MPPLRTALFAFSAAILVAFSPADAQQRPEPARVVPDSMAQVQLSFAPVVRQAAPAVVNIYASRTVQARANPFFDDPVFRRFFGDALNMNVPRERMENTLGSGVILRGDGLVVTNAHVIKDFDDIRVVLADRREFEAQVVAADERVDLAVLRIDTKGETLPALQLRDSDDLQTGDLVLAIGNPFGVGQTVTSGIVSAVARTAVGISDFNFFIQTDAAINPGNSGGALVTLDGRLVGINTAIFSRTGGSIGIGFAIPANMVRTVVDAAERGGKLVRPWIGTDGQPVTPDLAAGLRLPRPAGVLINGVWQGGPADRAGLKVGDVVTAVNGRAVDDPDSLRYRIATLPVGGTAKLTVLRQGREQDLALTLIAPPEDPPRDERVLSGRHPLDGAQVVNLNPALIEEIGFQAAGRGVLVLQVSRGSTAGSLGFRPGDIVLEINEVEIDSVATLEGELRKRAAAWTVSIRRGDRVLSQTFSG